MWPKKLNLSTEECRALLRNYELEAYSSVMNAFRSQGDLTDDKTRILKDLRVAFHISDDRHKAEARRVSNDERFNTIADVISGYETSRTWTKEGRRTVPLIPRGLAETALIQVADTLSQRYTKQNDKMPHPSRVIVSRPEAIIFPDQSRIPPVPLFDEKSVIFDEKIAMKLEERIPLTTTSTMPEDDGWSRKRRSSMENINLNQKLYPHVMKAQQSTSSAKKGSAAKRPRKEKVSKNQIAAMTHANSHPAKFIDFEDSINRSQEHNRQNREADNMRMIHSYASNSLPLTQQNVKNSQKRHSQSEYSTHPHHLHHPSMMQQGNNIMKGKQSAANMMNQNVLLQYPQMMHSPAEPMSTKSGVMEANNMSLLAGRAENSFSTPIAHKPPALEKPPKIQILSNNPVKIIPSLSLKTLQSKGNVQVVQSPPGKVVLRSFNNEIESPDPRGIGPPQTIPGPKINVQKVQLMPVQSANSKANANFLIVRNNAASAMNASKIPNKAEHGGQQVICMPQLSANNKKDPSKIVTTTFTATKKNISNLQQIPVKPLSGATLTKIDADQSLQKIRLIPTSSAISRPLPPLTTTTTQIKLSKNSKLYPITYSNGTPFTEMYVVNRNSASPKSISVVKNNENIENEKVDWENELDKKHHVPQQKGQGTSRVIVQSIPNMQTEGIQSLKSSEVVAEPMNLEEIIAYESESHDEDDDKTVSQEEERSDIDVTDMVSYESDDERAQSLQSPEMHPVSDKLSELTREILKD
ncbi:BRCA2-interacting transcriptional repressor EMSY [Culicoides brevitarsis]|uniref:BRCA2-interacting transcriptional repressor EMSY n=1 Tax=Culicoides brevitarsis TaxID=469753 RepID=UPI00307C2ADD